LCRQKGLIGGFQLRGFEDLDSLSPGKLAGFFNQRGDGDKNLIQNADVIGFIIEGKQLIQPYRFLPHLHPDSDIVDDDTIVLSS